MKFDPDLLRNILKLIDAEASSSNHLYLKRMSCLCSDKEKLTNHLIKLEKYGYISGTSEFADNKCCEYGTTGLTRSGEELLSKIQDNKKWLKIKEELNLTNAIASIPAITAIIEIIHKKL